MKFSLYFEVSDDMSDDDRFELILAINEIAKQHGSKIIGGGAR